MKSYILKLFTRKPLVTILSIAIVATMICLFFIAVNNYFFSKSYTDSMDHVYRTAVTLDDSSFERSKAIISRSPVDVNLSPYLQKDIESSLIASHLESPLVKNLDSRKAVLGFSTSIKPYLAPFEDMEITKMRWELYDRASFSQPMEDMYIEFVNKYGNRDDSSVSPVLGLVRARCIKVEYLAPVGLKKATTQPFSPPETLQDRGLTPEDVPRLSERDLNDKLTILGYFEIDHSHSHLLPECEEIKYLKVVTRSLDSELAVPFVEGRVYDLALHSDIVKYHPPKEEEMDNGLSALGEINDQRYMEASLFGELWQHRVESIEQEFAPSNFWSQEIPRQLFEELDIQFEKDLAKSIYILSDTSPPVLELGKEYSETVNENFNQIIETISLNRSVFKVYITKDPYLLPEVRKHHINIFEDNLEGISVMEDKSNCFAYISKELAEQNNLQIGDSFDLCLYQSGFRVDFIPNKVIQSHDDQSDRENVIFYQWRKLDFDDPMEERLLIKDLEKTRCIVAGFYELQADLWLALDEDLYHPTLFDKGGNHIILKANDLDVDGPLFNADRLYYPIILQPNGMLTAHIKNGQRQLQAYEKQMKEKGLDNFIVDIDDQGYALIEEALNDFVKDSNQQSILLLVLSLLIYIAYAFMLIYFNKGNDTLQYILGASKRTRRKCLFVLFALYWFIGNIIGVISFIYFSSHRSQEFGISKSIDTLDLNSMKIIFDPVTLVIMISVSLSILLMSYLLSHYLAWRKIKI